jgi:hypothetical protein
MGIRTQQIHKHMGVQPKLRIYQLNYYFKMLNLITSWHTHKLHQCTEHYWKYVHICFVLILCKINHLKFKKSYENYFDYLL